MIKVLILYYLSLKSTHGYEIQKFIQVNHMDSWTKIQSGSIYYALAKLEKEGLIALSSTVSVGAKARKIYSITDRGRAELKQLVKSELKRPICETGSDKFIVYPLLTASNQDEIKEVITSHIESLERKKRDILKWQKIKETSHPLEVETISFEMMLSSLDYQVKWHRALLRQLDRCMEASEEVAKLIRAYDFSDSELVADEHITDLATLKAHTLK